MDQFVRFEDSIIRFKASSGQVYQSQCLQDWSGLASVTVISKSFQNWRNCCKWWMDQKQMNQKQCETEKKKEQQGLCEDFLDKVLVAKFSIVPQSHK